MCLKFNDIALNGLACFFAWFSTTELGLANCWKLFSAGENWNVGSCIPTEGVGDNLCMLAVVDKLFSDDEANCRFDKPSADGVWWYNVYCGQNGICSDSLEAEGAAVDCTDITDEEGTTNARENKGGEFGWEGCRTAFVDWACALAASECDGVCGQDT